jgi:GntR family transcriptional regulator / MocR family aminotransferase
MIVTGTAEGAGRRGAQARLYGAIRAAILEGRLPAGARLPASRVLAQEAGVARQTVVQVYERLIDEGYAAARVGAGTFVAAGLPAAPPANRSGVSAAGSAEAAGDPAAGPTTPPPAPLPGPGLVGSAWARRALAAPREAWAAERPAYDFRPGVPDWEIFPHVRWRRLLARRWREAGRSPALGRYGDPAGYRPLREALAGYLARSRGLRCAPEQIVVVSGSQQALDLLARVALDPGDAAALEEPGYPPARAVLLAAGARLVPLAVDGAGVVVGALPPPARAPRLVYVTPSHQYPAGVTLSLARRLQLLERAGAGGTLVVEDDYDSELRYAGPPLPALQGLDERGCVAYVGSCSSVLFPPLRVGWIVAPPALVAPLVAAKWLADRQTPTLDQQVLTDFIAGGHLTRHLRRARALYGTRRAALVAAAERHLPGCRLAGEAAGLQTPLYLPPETDEGAVVREGAARGVGVYPLGPCYGAGPSPPGLLLGYCALAEPAIEEGVRRLAGAIGEASRGATRPHRRRPGIRPASG